MIKLTKTDMPEVLVENAENWTTDFLAKLELGEKPSDYAASRYRHAQIKESLVAETGGKCAYCESKLQHIHHGDVEHIVPKSLAPEKRFEWTNLTLACEVCNQNKADKDPLTAHIIDPYVIDPSEHLVFVGALVFTLGTHYGKSTQVLLDLNRSALAEQRRERLEKIMAIFETLVRGDLPLVTRKAIFMNLMVEEAGNQSAYSAMVRAVIAGMRDKLPAELLE